MTWITDNYIEVFGAVTGILYVILEIRQNRLLWPVGIVTSAVYIWVFFTGRLYADMGLQAYYLVISVMGWYWWARGSGLRAQGTGQRAQSTEFDQEDSPFEGGKGDVLDDLELRENSVYSVVKKGFGRALGAESGEQRARSSELRPALTEESVAQGRELNLETSPFEGGEGDVKNKDNSNNPVFLQVSKVSLKTAIILLVIFVLIFTIIWSLLDRFTDSPVPVADSFITSLSIIATWMLARKIYEHWYLWMVVNSFATVLFLSRELYPTAILYMVYFIMSFTGLFVWRRDLPAKTGSAAG